MGWDRILGWFGWCGRNKPLDPAGAQYARRLRRSELASRARQSVRFENQVHYKPSVVRRMMPCQRY